MTEQERLAMLNAMEDDKEGRSGSRKFWSLESNFEGTKTIRILPPLKNLHEIKFYFSHKVHWIDGTPYEDLEQTVYDHNGNLIHEAESDPIQRYVKKLYKSSERNTDEWKLAGSLNAKQRYITRIVVRNSEDPSTEIVPVFYEFGPTIYDMIFHIIKDSDFGNIVDPINGRDYNITKKGKGRQSRYETSTPSATVTPIFSDKEKLRSVFENASKMFYTDLLEFKSSEEVGEALKEHLGIATKTQAVVETNITNKNTPQPAPISAQVEPDSIQENDSEIDDILNGFV